MYTRSMNHSDFNFTTEELTRYSVEDATDIGRLLPYLSDAFDGSPTSKERLESIISSSFHTQLVARSGNEIVGIATLSILLGAGSGKSAWLEDFVVSPNVRGTGVADALWNAIIDWCKQQQVKSLNFTSRPSRVAAHHFYKKRGATIRETDSFRIRIT